ncbi:MAG TPA: hypothetical protein DEP69_02885 [Acidimicrobiaceae bacterium]|nr:hypothetical protein [Acidimicrobiaceae bacterium]
MIVEITQTELALRTPLRTAHGDIAARAIIRVSAGDDGCTGRSEAAPLPGFGLETYPEALAELQRWADRRNADGPADLPRSPCARAAAAGALANLDAALEHVSLTELLTGAAGEPHPRKLAVQALVGHPDPAAAAAAAQRAAEAGHLAVKLKVAQPPEPGAAPDVAAEVARIVEVRRALPAAVALRLDANGGWDQSTAGRVLRSVSRLDIDFVETPTPQPADWAQLSRRTGARIAADEHLGGPDAAQVLDQLIDAGAIAVAVLKPAAVGGPQAAYELACRASVSGVGSVVSSFLCGPDGLRVARDVALAVAPDAVHGVGTGALFTEPLPDDVTPRGGYLVL